MSWDWHLGITGDATTRARLSPERQIEDLPKVEAAFARAMGDVGAVPADLSAAAATAIEAADLDADVLCQDAALDGMPVPGMVRQLKKVLNPALHPALHAGLTSQDVMDTALMLAVKDYLDCIEARLKGVIDRLDELSETAGAQPLMGRTRMQAALPITLDHRLQAWRAPLALQMDSLPALRRRVLVIQMGGPVGTAESFVAPVGPLRDAFADRLDLASALPWHTDRSRIMELGAWVTRVTGALAKIGHDVALMAQQGVDEINLASGGRSSAMAHKSNPVKAEILVALGRDTSVQLGALHLAQEHELERSGTAWALEWMVLPRIMEAGGGALLRAQDLLNDLSFPLQDTRL